MTYQFDLMKYDSHIRANDQALSDDTYNQNLEAGLTTIHTGFIAQEVEAAAREIGYDFHGVVLPQNEKDNYGLRYAEFVVPIVKAVQELNAENIALKQQVSMQQQLISELALRIEKLEAAQR